MKFGFSNIRRLRKVSPIEIRPITLLVGKNSSGKSTFLRTIPLFRQSINTKTSSPILWYGDLVDFGSFQISTSANSKNEPISFSFILDQVSTQGMRFQAFFPEMMMPKVYKNVAVDIFIGPTKERTAITRMIIRIPSEDYVIDLHFEDEGILASMIINDVPATFDLSQFQFGINSGALFPDLFSYSTTENSPRKSGSYYIVTEETAFEKEAFRLIRSKLDNRIGNKTLTNFVTILFHRHFLNRELLRTLSNSLSSRFRTFVRNIAASDRNILYNQLAHLVIAAALPTLVGSISRELKSIFATTLYIGPARARSERYYRYQDLAVAEIDPDGKNFPMFLNALSWEQKESLSNWIKELFGYGVKVSQESGHISIELTESGKNTNVIDVGYGVSQILPVLGQIWWARARLQPRRGTSGINLLAIEQPELHLHPAHQALLADALVGEALVNQSQNAASERIHFIIETHSETLINRLGELISREKISPDDVQILLFEADGNDSALTTVRQVKYDNEGVLIDWPIGFFEPEIY